MVAKKIKQARKAKEKRDCEGREGRDKGEDTRWQEREAEAERSDSVVKAGPKHKHFYLLTPTTSWHSRQLYLLPHFLTTRRSVTSLHTHSANKSQDSLFTDGHVPPPTRKEAAQVGASCDSCPRVHAGAWCLLPVTDRWTRLAEPWGIATRHLSKCRIA